MLPRLANSRRWMSLLTMKRKQTKARASIRARAMSQTKPPSLKLQKRQQPRLRTTLNQIRKAARLANAYLTIAKFAPVHSFRFVLQTSHWRLVEHAE